MGRGFGKIGEGRVEWFAQSGFGSSLGGPSVGVEVEVGVSGEGLVRFESTWIRSTVSVPVTVLRSCQREKTDQVPVLPSLLVSASPRYLPFSIPLLPSRSLVY